MLLPSTATAVDLSLPAVEAAPGERVLVPVAVSGLSGSTILSLNIDVRFDLSVLPRTSVSADRRNSLTANWSLAANARQLPDAGNDDGQLLLAGATASATIVADGTLLFLAITVPEDATLGASTPLRFGSVLFNDGSPVAVTTDGSLTIVGPRVKADFSAHPLEGAAPLEVRFEDLSSDGVDNWSWDFGDGTTSTEEAPLHVYQSAGDYTVSLTVTSAAGTDTETKLNYVHVVPDQQPPAIVEGPIARGITHNGADLFWKTNEHGDSEAQYCGLRFRPQIGNTDELMSGLAAELDDDNTATRLQHGDLSVFSRLDCGRVSDDRQQTNHNIRLTGLSPATVYVYRVRSTDEVGNASRWRGGIFVTRLRPDDVPPRIIWGPNVTATPNRAEVRWKTNEPGNSFVSISTNPGFANDVRLTVDDLVIDHRVWVDVEPGQTYYVRVRSTDGSGNSSSLKRTSFRTPRVDDSPPVLLGDPIVMHRTASQAVIFVRTDEAATVRLEYGLTEDYGASVTNDELAREQRILLNQLSARTVYHFRVITVDASGNRSVSGDFSFITTEAEDDDTPDFVHKPYVLKVLHNQAIIAWESDEDVTAIIEYGLNATFGERLEVADALRRHQHALTGLSPGTVYFCRVLITDLAGNGPVASKSFRFRTARTIDTTPPVPIGTVRITRRTPSQITVEWTTDEASDSRVDFGVDAADLSRQTGDDELTTSHSITLTQLPAATTVFLQVSSTDSEGNTWTGDVISATTRGQDTTPGLRIISGPDVVARTSSAVVLEWLTDRPATSAVEYGTTANFGSEAVLFERSRRHRVVLTGLTPATTYFLQATSSYGDEASSVSSRVLAVTTRTDSDTRPPGIRHITLSQIGSKTALVTWRVDEPAGGWVEVGRASGDYDRVFGGASLERRQHVLITGLNPGTTYHYRLRSVDAAGNESFSDNRTLRTGRDADSRRPRFIEGPTVVTSHATATFVWRTDESCYGTVFVGADGGLGTADEEIFESERSGTHHRITVTGLTPGRRYQFALQAADLSGNTTIVGNRRPGAGKVLRPDAVGDVISFTTDTDVDQLPPVLVSSPQQLSVSDTEVLIGWDTDEVSDTRLYLVQADGSESLVEYIPEHDFSHQALLTGLTPGTTYTVVAASTDPSNNGPSRSAPLTFTTPVRADATAPTLVSRPEVVTLNDVSATMRWRTNEAARAVVTYGPTTLDNRAATIEPSLEQNVQLNGLLPATTYRYVVEITDGSGNTAPSAAQGTFTTTAGADVSPPVLSTAPVASQLQPTAATIKWSTNEGTDGFVRFGTDVGNLDRNLGSGQVSRSHVVGLTNLKPATTYFFQASSADAWGNGPTTSTTGSFTTPAVQSLPKKPEGVRATVGAHGVVRLQWNAGSESAWRVYRAVGAGNLTAIAGPLSQASYADGGVKAGGDVRYQITAVNAIGSEGPASDVTNLSVSLTAGDFDGSGNVDFDDFFVLVELLGRTRSDAGFNAAADFDGDGIMTLNDIFAFVDLFGTRYSSGRPLARRADFDAAVTLAAKAHGPGSWSAGLQGPDSDVWGVQLEYDPAGVDLQITGQAEEDGGVLVLQQVPGRVVLAGFGQGLGDGLDRVRFIARPNVDPGFLRLSAAHGIDKSQRAWRAGESSVITLRPQTVALLGNLPNPFNPSTQIRFQLPAEMPVWLTIYDALGQKVTRLSAGEMWSAGLHALTWDGHDQAGRPAASGMYFSLLQTPDTRHTAKLLLLR